MTQATQQTYPYPPGPPRPYFYHPGAMAQMYPGAVPPHGMPVMYPPVAPMPPPGTTKDSTERRKKDDQAPAAPEDGRKEGGGLDLLASLALPSGNNGENGTKGAAIDKPIKPKKAAKKKKGDDSVGSAGKGEMLFIEQVRDTDVLCGRGGELVDFSFLFQEFCLLHRRLSKNLTPLFSICTGKSNHHPGNKRYRQVVSEMKRTYQSTGAKTAKTDLSRAIVEHVVGYGGRFIKRDDHSGQYFLLTKAQARRKTSQALRETKELKWTV